MHEYVSLQDIVEFSKRHKFRILKALAGTVAVVMGATFLMTPTYVAESLLLVKLGREYMYRPELGGDSGGMSLSRDRQTAQINSELAILRSQELFADTVRLIGVSRLYPNMTEEVGPGAAPPTVAIEKLEASVRADRLKDSDVIRVTLQHSDRQIAAQALNVLVDAFMAKHLNAFSDAATTSFLEQKVASSRTELQAAEEKLKAFQLRTRSFSADDQRTSLFTQRDELEAKRKAARSQVAGLEKRLAYLNSEKQKVSSDASRFSSEETKAVSDARAQLLELQLQEQKLLISFSETSRAVENVRSQIKLVEEFLAQQRATVGQGQFADDLERQIIATQADLRFQVAQAETLAGQISMLEKQIGEFTQSGAEYRELVRDREAAAKSHEAYSKRLEEFRASEEMDRQKIANISVIQAAAVPTAPIRPDKQLNFLSSLVLGVVIGFAWGLAVEWRQRREQLETAVIPVDQETLVAPGTVHWRRPHREPEAAPEDVERPPAPGASKGSGN
jgi:uncharacterized protein involved in exopolysaccharide biosynthesis